MSRLGNFTTVDLIARLKTEFDAELAINVHKPAPFGDGGRAKAARRRANAKLWNAFRDDEPWMYEFSQAEPHLTVVWDRHRDDKDPARTLLRKLLIGVGIWEPHVNHLWAVPTDFRGVIQPVDMARYRPWLMEAMGATYCQPTLLIGAKPLWLWRPDLRLSTSHGNIGVWRSKWIVMPLETPERLPKGELTDWTRLLRRFVDRMHDGHFLDYLPQKCIKCEAGVFWYDSDAVAWCKNHVAEGLKQQEKGVTKWRVMELASGQQEITMPGE